MTSQVTFIIQNVWDTLTAHKKYVIKKYIIVWCVHHIIVKANITLFTSLRRQNHIINHFYVDHSPTEIYRKSNKNYTVFLRGSTTIDGWYVIDSLTYVDIYLLTSEIIFWRELRNSSATSLHFSTVILKQLWKF